MRTALAQLDMVWEDKERSLVKAEGMIKKAAEAKSDIVIFPEMSFTGVSLNVKKVAEPCTDSPTVEKIQVLARRYGIAVGFGWAAYAAGDDKAKNCFTVVDAAGKKLADYAKMHPFTYGGESEHYQKGNGIVTFPFLGRTVGLFICYDLRFPEIFQIAARKADVFFVIANWPAIRSEHWTTLLRARAIETQSYVVGVNCMGARDNQEYAGGSMAVDSIGNILGKLTGREDVLVCDLDDRAWSLRNKFSTALDRREGFYREFFGDNR